MKKTFTVLISFLQSPKFPKSYADLRGKEFFLLLLITYTIVIPYALILDLAGIDQFDHKMDILLKDYKWLVAILAIFIAPLLEEPIYRLHLDFKKSSIWCGLGLSLLLISEAWITVVFYGFGCFSYCLR